MSETASILNNCTRRSLVVMDEIGRGTSTFDGMSIAWAVLEHLHELGPRTLFATHYHELTSLSSELGRVRNLNVLVKEWGDRIVFVHKVVEGASDRSYGIQVARLAGLPESVVARARQVLVAIQNEKVVGPVETGAERGSGQLDLFRDRLSYLLGELANLDTDRMTPIEALRTLARLKARYLGPEGGPEADEVAERTGEEQERGTRG
jgi:DNA mismatch repair protein MutS